MSEGASPSEQLVPSYRQNCDDGHLVEGGRGLVLLKQLEHILENDILINELGFVHPTQLAALNAESRIASSSNNIQATGGIMDESIAEQGGIMYDDTVFWNSDHKLAISTTELPLLYNAVLQVFFNSIRKYKTSADRDLFLQSEVLRHSKSLLLICCDFGSAWNSRKLVISRNPSVSLFMDELQLSALVLSHSPKCESSWNHRRWVIKHIAPISGDLPEIIGQESELVKKIAEQSKMSYRAWNHRCWLVSYMSRSQLIDELNKSRKWAELHIADNCCFHFRSRLMLKMLEDELAGDYGDAGHIVQSDKYILWEGEFKWNCLLIQRYIGREALWIHRRFLSKCWLLHFAGNHLVFNCSDEHDVELDVAVLLQQEFQLLLSCLNGPYEEFEDGEIQAEQAMSYFFWVLKQVPLSGHIELREKLREIDDLKTLCGKFCSQKILFWRDQLAGSVWEDILEFQIRSTR